MPPALPVVPLTTSDRIKATLASIAAEPKAELAATGLTALGGALALVSFALPWAGDNGLGVGTVDIHPRPDAWAFDTAAGWPLFLMAAVMLAVILASDKLEELMPGLAPTIRRLTESALPMLLGGILLGVGLLYLLLPWGCGGGISLLVTGRRPAYRRIDRRALLPRRRAQGPDPACSRQGLSQAGRTPVTGASTLTVTGPHGRGRAFRPW